MRLHATSVGEPGGCTGDVAGDPDTCAECVAGRGAPVAVGDMERDGGRVSAGSLYPPTVRRTSEQESGGSGGGVPGPRAELRRVECTSQPTGASSDRAWGTARRSGGDLRGAQCGD